MIKEVEETNKIKTTIQNYDDSPKILKLDRRTVEL